VKKTSSNKIGYHLPVECICYFNKLIEQRDVLVRNSSSALAPPKHNTKM